MKHSTKYSPQYHLPPETLLDWAHLDRLTKPPIWCSVDLRDGNQALITPMQLEEKIRYYHFLLDLGFKEIEVGFPAASVTEFAFVRHLIDNDLIPDDVAIQVLTQSRAHIIEKTFEAVRGAKQVIMHLYNSTSTIQRQQVFRKTEDQIIAIAETGAQLFNEYAKKSPETDFVFQYSPESFSGTEPEFALKVCNALIDIWQPQAGRQVIINLPATVEHSMPHVYAQQVAYMHKYLNQREHIIISLHPHNDRGTGVAAAEMGMLAGADRIEGTLFGNGERTGNVDIITLAGNLYTHGVDPQLDLSDMPRIVRMHEEINKLNVPERHPYAGSLAFAAFSGSHQDAIAKGMRFREEEYAQADESRSDDGNGSNNNLVNSVDITWTVPYLPIDPRDVSREYETDIIRINSQSGKGGVSYILEQNFGFKLPVDLREELGYFIKDMSDTQAKELLPDEIHTAFAGEYINGINPINISAVDWHKEDEDVVARVSFNNGEGIHIRQGRGNGHLDAARDAIRAQYPELNFQFEDFSQHALGGESNARAASYVKVSGGADTSVWGVGVHTDIATASVYALISALNRLNARI